LLTRRSAAELDAFSEKDTPSDTGRWTARRCCSAEAEREKALAAETLGNAERERERDELQGSECEVNGEARVFQDKLEASDGCIQS